MITTLTTARQLRSLFKNTLFMNAMYLMLSTGVIAVSGLVFWIVVTHTHRAGDVGLATTLLSVSGLLSLLGLAGFDTTFVRFLPGTKRKNDYINSGFIVITIINVALATILGLALPLLSQHFLFLYSTWTFAGFVFFTVVSSLNIVTNAVFLAFKQAQYILIINSLFSVCKILLPLIVTTGNAETIFVLAGCAQLVGLVLSIAWMRRAFAYRFTPTLHVEALRTVKKFSLSMYASSICNLLPPTILPLVVVYKLGSASAAYYYMAFTMASLLYTIGYASMQSAFAEGSHNQAAIGDYIKKASKIIAVVLLPAIAVTLLCSNLLLSIFGPAYAAHADWLLWLLAIGGLPVAVYSGFGAIFKVTKNLSGMVWMNIAYAVIIISASYMLIPVLGLAAIGWAWIIGNLAACCIGAFFLIYKNNTRR
jgi:O-antigen/teichoic acid export membrane protein